MCLVAFAWKSHPRWRLALAGNRDEFHGRPTAPLAVWPGTGILAGRDLRSGGTWVGLGRDGRVAVITNVRDGLPPAFNGLSRGALPVDFLAGDRSAAAHAKGLAGIAGDYAPFNLVLADADACAYVGNHPASGAPAVTPGVHGLSNGAFDASWPKTRRLREALQAWVDAGHDDLALLWQALADERQAADADLPDTGVGLALERRLSPAFIRGQDYGTRASTVILIGHYGESRIHERRFGPEGVFEGETVLVNQPLL
ncbi:NRDE family protein [Thermomonas sp.]|uniref:NRDE family protein n=1 Tax=Thermomonas sp. TaxID=1971895 RepID=UPI0035B35F92